MKALTICQPYAQLIVIGRKLVENRIWSTRYRGPLLIHAGKSRDWLKHYGGSEAFSRGMAFGAIVGVAELVECLELQEQLYGKMWPTKYQVLVSHMHTEGPWCWILENARRFDTPILYRGAQGLFNIPDSVVEAKMQPEATAC